MWIRVPVRMPPVFAGENGWPITIGGVTCWYSGVPEAYLNPPWRRVWREAGVRKFFGSIAIEIEAESEGSARVAFAEAIARASVADGVVDAFEVDLEPAEEEEE